MSALLSIWHEIVGIATTADYWTLGAAVVIIIIAGFAIDGVGKVLSATVLALIGFALVLLVIDVVKGNAHDVEGLAATDWTAFADLKMLKLLAYAITFGVLITIVNLIRSAVR